MKNVLFPMIFSILLCSCNSSRCVIYNLQNYKDELGDNYIPIYDSTDAEWMKAKHILKDIVAPAKWGTEHHQLCGWDFRLYVLTTKKNHRKLQVALPTLWKPQDNNNHIHVDHLTKCNRR